MSITYPSVPPEIADPGFQSWSDYAGLLADVVEVNPASGQPMRTHLFGFSTCKSAEPARFQVPRGGAAFGFVIKGSACVGLPGRDGRYGNLGVGQWFCLSDGAELELTPDSQVMVAQSCGFFGLSALGGPIEQVGRLSYIDRCSDTLLMGPPVLGDPCLNHLHFPAGISQTEHSHPSGRFGAVVQGRGWCETASGRSVLRPGVVFVIPAGGMHRFITDTEEMDVIAFHPDTDWGPTDRDHPMINRTLVDGVKLDNSIPEHQAIDLQRVHRLARATASESR